MYMYNDIWWFNQVENNYVFESKIEMLVCKALKDKYHI